MKNNLLSRIGDVFEHSVSSDEGKHSNETEVLQSCKHVL